MNIELVIRAVSAESLGESRRILTRKGHKATNKYLAKNNI